MTIKDVAKASGVSPATVSFVLNETRGQTIPAATRERVRQAAHDLGYVTDGIGRALREGTSRVVLLDVGPLHGGPILEGFIVGMSNELAVHGYSLLVQHGTHDRALQSAIAAISPRAVVDIAGPFAAVDPDNAEGGSAFGMLSHALTQLGHLVARGHRRIAFGLPDSERPSPRWDHVRDAARHLGIAEPTPVRIAGQHALAHLLREHPDITAVAAFDDETAVTILGAMADLRLSAPDDLAVIGFGDSDFGSLWRPALTTVHVDAPELGQHAARVALGIDDLPPLARGSRVIVRASA